MCLTSVGTRVASAMSPGFAAIGNRRAVDAKMHIVRPLQMLQTLAIAKGSPCRSETQNDRPARHGASQKLDLSVATGARQGARVALCRLRPWGISTIRVRLLSRGFGDVFSIAAGART